MLGVCGWLKYTVKIPRFMHENCINYVQFQTEYHFQIDDFLRRPFWHDNIPKTGISFLFPVFYHLNAKIQSIMMPCDTQQKFHGLAFEGGITHFVGLFFNKVLFLFVFLSMASVSNCDRFLGKMKPPKLKAKCC